MNGDQTPSDTTCVPDVAVFNTNNALLFIAPKLMRYILSHFFISIFNTHVSHHCVNVIVLKNRPKVVFLLPMVPLQCSFSKYTVHLEASCALCQAC